MKQLSFRSLMALLLGVGLVGSLAACTTYVEDDTPDDDVDIHVDESTPSPVVVPPAETPDVHVNVEQPAAPAPAPVERHEETAPPDSSAQ